MHVVEFQRMGQKLLSPLGSIGAFIGKIIGKLTNYFDKIVYILFNRIESEFNRKKFD